MVAQARTTCRTCSGGASLGRTEAGRPKCIRSFAAAPRPFRKSRSNTSTNVASVGIWAKGRARQHGALCTRTWSTVIGCAGSTPAIWPLKVEEARLRWWFCAGSAVPFGRPIGTKRCQWRLADGMAIGLGMAEKALKFSEMKSGYFDLELTPQEDEVKTFSSLYSSSCNFVTFESVCIRNSLKLQSKGDMGIRNHFVSIPSALRSSWMFFSELIPQCVFAFVF